MATKYGFLEPLIPNDPILMDLAAGMRTPPKNRSVGSADAVFGMDDRDIVGETIHQAAGNDYGFDSFDLGNKKSGDNEFFDRAFISKGEDEAKDPNCQTNNWQFGNVFLEE